MDKYVRELRSVFIRETTDRDYDFSYKNSRGDELDVFYHRIIIIKNGARQRIRFENVGKVSMDHRSNECLSFAFMLLKMRDEDTVEFLIDTTTNGFHDIFPIAAQIRRHVATTHAQLRNYGDTCNNP